MANKFLSYDGLLYLWQKLKAYFVKAEEGKGLSSEDYTAEDRAKLQGLTNYELPAASAETLGGVKVGAGLTIEAGVLSAAGGAGSANWEDVQNKPETFPPEAHTHAAADITDLDAAIEAKGYQTKEQVQRTAQTYSEVMLANISSMISKDYPTKKAVEESIAKAGHLKRQIVDSLPNAGEADADTIYMVIIPAAEGENRYTEWMVIEGSWESLGTRDVDLNGYVKAEDLESITNGEIDGLISA